VGCGLISFRNAVILVSIFAILGVMLQGQQVMIPNNFYALNGSKIFSNML
jgi:phosphate/sulfate permease